MESLHNPILEIKYLSQPKEVIYDSAEISDANNYH